MDIRLLGPVEALVGGRPVALGAPKQRALLSMLALHAGRAVSADRLVEGLWGEDPPASAPKMVQQYVSNLRRVLDGDEAEILTRGRGYELQLGGEVDAVHFERLLEQGRAREALGLWRGEALADLADEPFAAAEIRRLDELRLRATELAIDAELAAGRHGDVIGELTALIAAYPLGERPRAQLMLALYRAGRQSEALDAYRDARATLVEEFGVEPGPELRELQRRILEHDAALDLPTEPAPTAEPVAAPAMVAAAPARRRARRLLGVAALALLAGATAFVVIRALESDGLGQIEGNAVGVIDPESGDITAQYRVGRGPAAIAAGAGGMWVANRLDGTVARIDTERRELVTVDVGGEPTGLAFGAGSLWVTDGRGRTLAQVDPRVNRVVQRFDVGNAAADVTVGFGTVWVASAVDGTVVPIRLKAPKAGEPIAVGARPTAIAAGADGVWVASEATASVVRIDPRSGKAVARIRVGDGPSAVAVGAGAVWVANRLDGTVSRIDHATERVTDAVRVGREPDAIAVDRDGAWVANAGEETLVRIDPRSRRADAPIRVRSSPIALALLDGRLWSATLPARAAHRGGVLRATETAYPHAEPVPLDPHSLYLQAALLYDGLVGYRRVGGSAGGTLVANLARSLPDPSPDGRTYTFRLRPGLRFSNGAPVRPRDVRASLERLVRSPYSAPEEEPPIRGADACTPNRCDLSRGVEVDDVAGTVTLRLSRPDADVMHKLQNAFVVPAGTADVDPAAPPPPGTGPYIARRWDARRGGVLVRNPHFSVWTPDRPDGFADRIELRFERASAQTAAVEHNKADVALFGGETGRVPALRARYGARLHTDPLVQVWYVWLNVRAPPFDDARVRRALNYAVDRGRVGELLGTEETHKPTCQMLPPGIPGYAPSCAFTVRPDPAGGWTAPDLARARRLIAASGTRGMKVELWGATDFEAVNRYLRSLLRRLGYRVEIRSFNDLGPTVEAARRAPRVARLGLFGWIAANAGPHTFLRPLLSCSASPLNLSGFCDPDLDARMARAGAAQGPTAITQWRRVETALSAKAPTIPLVNHSEATFVAERVGNYQHHPIWGVMLDQLWVR